MHVTAKPSSFQCNLKCDYCFYLEKESQFTHEKWMDDSTLKEFIKQYIAASGNQVYFTWQGGEPTLAGLDFFRKVIHYQQRYAGQKFYDVRNGYFLTKLPLILRNKRLSAYCV